MGSIRIQNVTKQFGGRIVLDNVSLELNGGQTVGLVGANGAGKTTLFKLITGQLAPDMGTVTRSKGLEIGYLAQEPEIDLARTLHDEVLTAFAEVLALERRQHELSEMMAAHRDQADLATLMNEYDRVNARFITLGGYEIEQRLAEVVGGLGFTKDEYPLPMATLSGGQKCRVALAKLLLQDQQFLLLDEPTNHLDIDAVRWLEKFLAGHRGGAVLISHDRYLLDRLTDAIVEVERGGLTRYPGNYTNYAKAREVRRLTQARQFEQDREFIEKERDFIARHLAGQRSSEAKGRRTRLERRIAAGEFALEKPAEQRRIGLQLTSEELPAGTILTIDQLSKSYDEKRLFKDLSLQVRSGEALGITGPNGTGKSTLLKIALGRVPADAGRVEFDRRVSVGYYAQESGELDPAAMILSEIQAVRPDLSEQSVRSLLGRFLFSGDNAFKRVGTLSGGELSRVRLIKLILSSPNMLVLDEPTNHLDIPSREVLEDALLEFPGTILVVSHDRYFLDRLVDRLLVIRPDGHAVYQGDYSYYLEQVEQQRALRESQAAEAGAPRAALDTRRAKSAAPAGRPPNKAKGPRSAYQRMSLEELEALIAKRELQISVMNERFGDAAVFRDPQALAELQAEFDAAKLELTAAEAAWLEKAEGSG